jgi:hypothetical protein
VRTFLHGTQTGSLLSNRTGCAINEVRHNAHVKHLAWYSFPFTDGHSPSSLAPQRTHGGVADIVEESKKIPIFFKNFENSNDQINKSSNENENVAKLITLTLTRKMICSIVFAVGVLLLVHCVLVARTQGLLPPEPTPTPIPIVITPALPASPTPSPTLSTQEELKTSYSVLEIVLNDLGQLHCVAVNKSLASFSVVRSGCGIMAKGLCPYHPLSQCLVENTTVNTSVSVIACSNSKIVRLCVKRTCPLICSQNPNSDVRFLNLTGTLSPAIGFLTTLTSLCVDRAPIPPMIVLTSTIFRLISRNYELHGTLPYTISKLTMLNELYGDYIAR